MENDDKQNSLLKYNLKCCLYTFSLRVKFLPFILYYHGTMFQLQFIEIPKRILPNTASINVLKYSLVYPLYMK